MSEARSAGGRVLGLVVAAGASERFGGGLPKQFRPLAGRTVLERSIAALAASEAVAGIVVVLAPDQAGGAMCDAVRALPGVVEVVAGGAHRSESVRRGLDAVAAGGAELVLVHDAARPLVSRATVEAVVEATRRHGAAVPCLAIHDTVKETAGDFVAGTRDRRRLRLAQTPQGARLDWLVQALDAAREAGAEITDDAAALELAGRDVAVVEGDPGNLKITTLADFEQAARILGGEAMDLRVGSGFDIHRFDPDRTLVLGGVPFEGQPGLAGHSDADVVLHAAMDALLGAAGLPDIGVLFPPGDARFAGAASTRLAEDVARRLQEAGFEPVNLDVTVLAERPRIGPSAGRMREAIAACLGLEPGRVGIKATTLEGLGALGRAEGIAAQAVALVRRIGGR